MIRFLIGAVVLTAIAGASLAIYLLPLVVGLLRRVPDIGSVAVINILLGWTLVGWAAALALALRSARADRPAIQIVQHLPAAGPITALPPPAAWSGRPGGPGPRPDPPPLVLPPRPAGAWHTTSVPDPYSSQNAPGPWEPAGFDDAGSDADLTGPEDLASSLDPAGSEDPAGFGEPAPGRNQGAPWGPAGPWEPGDLRDRGGARRSSPWDAAEFQDPAARWGAAPGGPGGSHDLDGAGEQ